MPWLHKASREAGPDQSHFLPAIVHPKLRVTLHQTVAQLVWGTGDRCRIQPVRPRHAFRKLIAPRRWRNWQTRMVQVDAPQASSFDASLTHNHSQL
jgi:hypothetical protein